MCRRRRQRTQVVEVAAGIEKPVVMVAAMAFILSLFFGTADSFIRLRTYRFPLADSG
jgi:hypothetical protein